MYSKASASEYVRRFGLSLNEWRIISLLWAAGTLSLSRLSHQAQFDRGLTSRTVNALIDNGYVARHRNPDDGRGLVLELTPKGNDVVATVQPVASERNRQLLSCLTQKEAEIFDAVLDKLTHQARAMLDIEREKALQENHHKEASID
ncbi:MarR family transcriptional regulator [Paralcaligenes sp. KSB-10]|uniref:MarR family winged helix-turn-helix transcriptional regulator n=1 Tax=Paralcaligenes sp. KSB-10 TaxID=2901142 RepID=UPI001E3B34FD|nr:MarR family transcriptional regulator [Paralcaligenes sp. KSB-10]UHL64217.1 MarR family transcriptional regulator [Paralcaligenes sp. KSB-10]